MNTPRPEFGAGKARVKKPAPGAPEITIKGTMARRRATGPVKLEPSPNGMSAAEVDERLDAERAARKGRKPATPKPPTKLPKGPSEGSLKPADSVAPETMKMTPEEQFAAFRQTARDLDCDPDDEKFKGVLRKLSKRAGTQR